MRPSDACISNLTIFGPDNGLSPGRRQAIIWTNDGILLIGPLGTNFSEILIEIYIFHSRKCIGKWRPFCLASMCYYSEQLLILFTGYGIFNKNAIYLWSLSWSHPEWQWQIYLGIVMLGWGEILNEKWKHFQMDLGCQFWSIDHEISSCFCSVLSGLYKQFLVDQWVLFYF